MVYREREEALRGCGGVVCKSRCYVFRCLCANMFAIGSDKTTLLLGSDKVSLSLVIDFITGNCETLSLARIWNRSKRAIVGIIMTKSC